jgi:hypothetical protein
MSLILGDAYIKHAIREGNDEEIISIVEEKIRLKVANENEVLLCGLLMLSPPVADAEKASSLFKSIFGGNRSLEAAIWDAYRYSYFFPENSDFKDILNKENQYPIAAHILSLVDKVDGHMEDALEKNRLSRSIRIFPFNALEALNIDYELSGEDRMELWDKINDLIIIKDVDRSREILTIDGYLQRYWDNLITGTRITSVLWDYYKSKYQN